MYNFKGQPAGDMYRGPVAQDWHELFPSEKDPLRIDTVDPAGVAFAAIKGLYSLAKVAALEASV
jgi:hypothetical protein